MGIWTILQGWGESHCGVMAILPDCENIVGEFDLQLRSYAYFP